MKNIIHLIVVLVFALNLSACISTQVKGYSDQAYQNYKIKKVMVQVNNASLDFAELLEETMVKELKDQGIEADIFTRMFSPTRQWESTVVDATLKKQGFDALMTIQLAGANSGSQHHGYIANSSASMYGNTAYAHTTMTPMVTVHRNTATKIKIWSVSGKQLIWLGEAKTRAGGLMYMSDSSTTESIAEDVVESLIKSGHL